MTGLRAAVVGTGSWGTTFAAVLADAGCAVRVWGRDADRCAEIAEQHTNGTYLPGIRLPEAVTASTDPGEVLADADVVAIAVPSQAARAILQPLADLVPDRAIAVSLMKGVELATDRRMSEVVAEALHLPARRVAVLSGPNLAREIALRQPTATVVASTSRTTARAVVHACATSYFRPYSTLDVVGVELCGAVKNVIAMAVGIAEGRGLGYNTVATVVTRGLAEMTRLGLALGADARTFAGLAGLGDLMATCASPQSRNHALGVRIGQGMDLDEAVATVRGTAEGVKTSRSVLDLGIRVGVEMPITRAVVGVVGHRVPVDTMVARLLARPHRSEHV